MSYTPGPWWYEKEDEGTRHFVACNLTECDETTICTANYGEDDAHLIAAAPNLLEELEDRFAQTKCGCGHPHCKRCRYDRDTQAVIDKARGRTTS